MKKEKKIKKIFKKAEEGLNALFDDPRVSPYLYGLLEDYVRFLYIAIEESDFPFLQEEWDKVSGLYGSELLPSADEVYKAWEER